MGLMNQAKEDMQTFTSDLDGWGTSILLENADGSESITLNGLAIKHHLGIDTEGNFANAKTAHISFSEQLVIDGGFVVRDANNEVNMAKYKATFEDNRGVSVKYIIREWFPDESLGHIMCILADFKP